MFALVSYDIADPKRLNRVARTMKNYGVRVQRSIFECLLDEQLLKECRQKLYDLIEPEEDSVRIYVFCEKCRNRITILGLGELTRDEDVFLY